MNIELSNMTDDELEQEIREINYIIDSCDYPGTTSDEEFGLHCEKLFALCHERFERTGNVR